MDQQRIVITVVGKDTVGIIARVCTYLAESNINILDLNQSILQGFFNMVLIADIAASTLPFDRVQDELKELGERMGLDIKTQREEIFEMMHRI